PADAAPPAAVPTPQPMPVVGALRVFPGITAQLTRSVLATPLNALVLEAYGMGNGPSRNEAFVEALAEAVARGVTIVDCTQCLRGTVDLSGYATGADLARAGVLSGYDTTVEAALAKLIFLYSQALPTDTIRELMGVSLCGEVTPQAK
ncbi:MAG: asparaginase, partial [Chloroflexi bacterium]|nr:asparaginase [Chloroflexota bacterium]